MFLIASASKMITGAWIMYAVYELADIALASLPCRFNRSQKRTNKLTIIATPKNCSHSAYAKHCQ